MILLLGADTFIGQAFRAELGERYHSVLPLSAGQANFADLNVAYDYLRRFRPEFVINACSLSGPADDHLVDADKERALYANVLLPQTLTRVCRMRNIPWAHISSGTIFRGAKVLQGGNWKTEINLNQPGIRRLLRNGSPRIQGFNEKDEPNHCFVCPPCDFYSGAVALGEQAIRDVGNGYVFRHGTLLHDGEAFPNGAAALSGSLGFEESCEDDHANGRTGGKQHLFVSATLLSDFCSASRQLWERGAVFGTYNIINPGVLDLQKFVQGSRPPGGNSFYNKGCILDDSKLRSAGIQLRRATDLLGGGPLSSAGDGSAKNTQWSDMAPADQTVSGSL